MKRRTSEGQPRDISAHLQPLVDDDAFLTALSHGDDPSDGTDPLAALFLELRSDVNRQVPPAPVVATDPSDGEGPTPGADAPHASGSATPIDRARSRRGGRATSPWTAGLIGAAAATALVVGTGAALYGATPGSPLWGPATAVFGDRAAAVELASTLEDLEAANASGDTDHARHLIDQARELVGAMNAGSRGDGRERDGGRGAEATTANGERTQESKAPAAPGESSSPQAGETVTERVTETVTVSVTPEAEPGTPRPAQPGPATASVPPAPVQQPPVAQPSEEGEPTHAPVETTARPSTTPQQ